MRNGKIAVYFGRLIDSAHVAGSSLRHQGSCYFIAETDTMSLLSGSNLVSSHSFNNVITYDEQEEQFIFLDRGDGNQRVIFPFKGGIHYSEMVQSDGTILAGSFSDGNTYSQLAGLLSFQDRYVLVGTYENKTILLKLRTWILAMHLENSISGSYSVVNIQWIMLLEVSILAVLGLHP